MWKENQPLGFALCRFSQSRCDGKTLLVNFKNSSTLKSPLHLFSCPSQSSAFACNGVRSNESLWGSAAGLCPLLIALRPVILGTFWEQIIASPSWYLGGPWGTWEHENRHFGVQTSIFLGFEWCGGPYFGYVFSCLFPGFFFWRCLVKNLDVWGGKENIWY